LTGADAGLRVLLADEDASALEELAGVLRDLGHEVIARAESVADASHAIASEDPDAALVVLHRDREHALALIGEIAEYASGPVVALLEREDPEFVARAAESGIAAYARPREPDAVRGALEVALRRHAETEALTERVGQLETALGRRATIERAKGILMERHGTGEQEAFERLRSQAREQRRKVFEVARAIAEDGEPVDSGA
jgi:AmiR/NasT family two-component response regulator